MNRFLQFALTTALLAFAAPAMADEDRDMAEKPEERTISLQSATAEVGAGTSKSASSLPSSTFFYERLGARATLGENLTLNASLTLNEDLATEATSEGGFATSGDHTFFGTLGATIAVSDHLDIGASFNGSPSSTRDVGSSVSLKGGKDADALLRVDSSSIGGTASIAYDSADDEEHDVDVGLDASASLTGYSADSTVAQTAVYAGAPDASRFPKTSASLMQGRIGVGAELTIFDDTDVGASGAYYIYDQKNPAAIGTFDAVASSGASYGIGAPILPQQWSVRPEVGHRFGRFSVRGYYEFADLAAPGVAHTVGGRVQVSLGKVKLYATSSYRANPAPDVETSKTWNVGVGITTRF